MEITESNIYKLNGTPLPAPSSSSVTWEDIHSCDSGRTLDAQMRITVIARKRKVSLTWDVLPQELMQRMIHPGRGSGRR